MKRMLGVATVVSVFGLLGIVCLPVHAQEKAITLNFANFFPPKHPIGLLMGQWCTEVEKRTNGRVKTTYYPGGILTPAPQTYASVLGGVADIGLSFNGYTKGRFPLSDLLTYPLGNKDAYQGSMLAHAFYKKLRPKEFAEVKVIFFHNAPPQRFGAKKPISTLEDLKGLKTRAGGGIEASIIEALGAVPVAMPMPDAYDSLQKGVLDAFLGATEALKGYKLAEQLTHVTYFTSTSNGVGYVVMNKDKWNAIPPDAQKVIDEIDEEYAEKMAKLWENLAEGGKEFFVQQGGKVIVLSKEEDARWTARIRPVVDKYVTELNSKGLLGDEALKFCKDYLKAHQK